MALSTATTRQIEGAFADFLVTKLEENKPAVEKMIVDAEGSIEAAVAKAIGNMPAPKGLLGAVFPLVKGEIPTYVNSLISQYGGSAVLWALLDSEAHALAKSLGG